MNWFVYISNGRMWTANTTKDIMSLYYNLCPCIEEYRLCKDLKEALKLCKIYNKTEEIKHETV